MLMYNGFRWMLGPVTEGSTDAAKKKGILYSIIGLICVADGLCYCRYNRFHRYPVTYEKDSQPSFKSISDTQLQGA